MTAMRSYLERAIVGIRKDLERRRRETPESDLLRRSERRAGGRSLSGALEREAGVIAEIKRASPARGTLDGNLNVRRRARLYARHGAVALSILTQPRGFRGSPRDLEEARAEVGLPILLKDFVLDRYQVAEAAAWGADAVLLIASLLQGPALVELTRFARTLGLEVLVEMHRAEEVPAALEARPDCLGVNARELAALTLDPAVHERMAGLLPRGRMAVAESGIGSPDRVRRLRKLGYRGFLVGASLSRSADPGGLLAGLARAARGGAETSESG
jgi:indole-3-glycerol phosphate synthase